VSESGRFEDRSLENRVARLENAFVRIAETLDEHTTLLRDIVTLLNQQGDQLTRIEEAIRERGSNGQSPS
jgi:hypothetical protein